MSGAFRFRIVSYNILAELFATKQVHRILADLHLALQYRQSHFSNALHSDTHAYAIYVFTTY